MRITSFSTPATLAAGFFVYAQVALSQPYTLSTVLLQGASIPNSTATFDAIQIETGFSIDENYVSFTQDNRGCNSINGIWLYNTASGQLKQLVKQGSTAPSTGGEVFNNCQNESQTFGDYSVVKGNHVVFAGYATGSNPGWGYYSAPVNGAAPAVVANEFTGIGAINFNGTIWSAIQHADDLHVVTPTGNEIVSIANIDGSNLQELAGPNTPVASPDAGCKLATTVFQEPKVTGNYAIFLGIDQRGYGAQLFLTGLTGIPQTPRCQPDNYIVYPNVVDQFTVLPGVPSNVIFQSNAMLALNQQELYFTASSPGSEPGNGPTAIFAENLDGSGGIRCILNLNSAPGCTANQLPGLTPPYTIMAMSAQFDTLVFQATSLSVRGSGIFAYQNGKITPVVETGDSIGDNVIESLWFGFNGLSNERIVFGFSGSGPNGIGLATPGNVEVRMCNGQNGLKICLLSGPEVSNGSLGIAAGLDGDVWLNSITQNKIVQFNPVNSAFAEFPIPTSNAKPEGMTLGSDNRIWFTEWNGGSVGAIDGTGKITEYSLGVSPTNAVALTTGPDANIWVTTDFSGIFKVTPQGTHRQIDLGNQDDSQPAGIVAGPDGNVWFIEWAGPCSSTQGSFHSIGKIVPSDNKVTFYPVGITGNSINGIAAGPDGRIWFANPGCGSNPPFIGAIHTDGTGFTAYTKGVPAGTDTIINGGDGNLYFGTFNNQIGRITPSGVVTVWNIPGDFSVSVTQMAVGPNKTIWFLDSAANYFGTLYLQ